jgi:hypothetical protein
MGNVPLSAAPSPSTPMPVSGAIKMDGLQRFTQTLLSSGDLVVLGTDAVAVYLVARNSVQSSANKRFPPVATLVKLVGIDKDRVTQALHLLQQRGYVQGKEGRYILREKSCLSHDNDKQVTEVTWDVVSPSSLLNIREFRKVLVSGELSDARILHIEHLQVNINNIQDGGIGVNSQPVHNHSVGNEAALGDLVSTLRPKELVVAAEPKLELVTAPAVNTNTMATPAVAAPSPSSPMPAPTLVRVEDTPVAPAVSVPVVAPAVSVPVVAPPVAPTVSVPVVAPTVAVDPAAQYQALRKQYLAEAYEAHVQALELAESVAEKAFRALLEHETKRPKKPNSWMMMFQQYAWESQEETWKQQKLTLQISYDQVVAERQRLMKALHLNHGVVPAYEQAALAKLRLEHPELSAFEAGH